MCLFLKTKTVKAFTNMWRALFNNEIRLLVIDVLKSLIVIVKWMKSKIVLCDSCFTFVKVRFFR